MLSQFLIALLLCFVMPPIFNVVYAFIVVKFNLWNELSELILCDSRTNHKINKDNILWLILPGVSSLSFIVIVFLHFVAMLYKIGKILLYPFIKVYELTTNGLLGYFNKVEDKRKFYKILNNH